MGPIFRTASCSHAPDMVADRGKKFDGCKRTVGDQNDIAIGKPAMDLQGLARPIEQCLGRSRLIGIETFGGSEQSEKGQRHDAIGPRKRKASAVRWL